MVDGVLSGIHRSPYQGQSIEFAEHKEYAPGDEVRHIDWRSYGRYDKYYVKRYEQETNLKAFLVVDASASMNYRSQHLSKLDVASVLAASLAYLLIRQQDAVGLLICRGSGMEIIPPRSSAGHFSVILKALEGLHGGGTAHMQDVAKLLREKNQHPLETIVFSDFFDEEPQTLPSVFGRTKKSQLSVFQVLDPAELEFPFEDSTLFRSMEDERTEQVDPREIRDSYLEEMNNFLQKIKQSCAESKVEYEQVRTDALLDRIVLRFITRREKGRAV